jgi:hypothetical protein
VLSEGMRDQLRTSVLAMVNGGGASPGGAAALCVVLPPEGTGGGTKTALAECLAATRRGGKLRLLVLGGVAAAPHSSGVDERARPAPAAPALSKDDAARLIRWVIHRACFLSAPPQHRDGASAASDQSARGFAGCGTCCSAVVQQQLQMDQSGPCDGQPWGGQPSAACGNDAAGDKDGGLQALRAAWCVEGLALEPPPALLPPPPPPQQVGAHPAACGGGGGGGGKGRSKAASRPGAAQSSQPDRQSKRARRPLATASSVAAVGSGSGNGGGTSAQPPLAAEGMITYRPIGRVRSCFKERNGTPRQGILAPHSRATLQIEARCHPAQALQGLAEFSHCWLLFDFHANTNRHVHSTIHPPMLDGAVSGVFATRTPHRPNAIGAWCTTSYIS